MSGEESTQTTQSQTRQNRQGGFSQKDSRYHPYSKWLVYKYQLK